MRRICFIILVIAGACSAEKSEIILFSKDSDDWFTSGEAEWTLINDEIVARLDSGDGFLMTDRKWQDFELELEFKPDSTINSGVFIRCTDQQLSAEECYEINIWDLHPNQEFRTGAVVTRASPLNYVETVSRWNTYRIRCVGDLTEAWINDTKVVELKDEDLRSGYIALQASGKGTITFRNLKLRSY